jgi:hypothetical protein
VPSDHADGTDKRDAPNHEVSRSEGHRCLNRRLHRAT